MRFISASMRIFSPSTWPTKYRAVVRRRQKATARLEHCFIKNLERLSCASVEESEFELEDRSWARCASSGGRVGRRSRSLTSSVGPGISEMSLLALERLTKGPIVVIVQFRLA